jgi:hypothetical protein
LLNEALNEPVVVTENSGLKRISKRLAAFKQLVNEPAKGNWRALKLLVDIRAQGVVYHLNLPSKRAALASAPGDGW